MLEIKTCILTAMITDWASSIDNGFNSDRWVNVRLQSLSTNKT